MRSGRLATTTPATSPRASGATRPAVSTAGRHWASPARLPRNVLIPYTAASPMATPARLPAATTASRFLAWPLAVSSVPVIGGVNPRQVRSGHEQQDVGWALQRTPRRHHGGDQRLHRFRPAPLPAGHR